MRNRFQVKLITVTPGAILSLQKHHHRSEHWIVVKGTAQLTRGGGLPTPLNKNREPDLSYVTGTVDGLAPHLRPGQILSLESTTYPGTTEEELLPRIEKTGLKVGQNIFLVYSPEREDPGSKDFNPGNIPKVIGGHTPACFEVGTALYAGAIKRLVPVSSPKTAEITKLLENIYRAFNIGLVNGMNLPAVIAIVSIRVSCLESLHLVAPTTYVLLRIASRARRLR